MTSLDVRMHRLLHGIPDAFLGGTGHFPNNPPVGAVLSAILKGGPKARILSGGWFETATGALCHRHFGRRQGEIGVYLDLEPDGTELPTESHWAFVEGFSPFTADVLLAVLAQLCDPCVGARPKYPAAASIPITANAILNYKGLKSWGLGRAAARAKVIEEMQRLSRILFDVHYYPVWDSGSRRWNSQGVSIVGDRLFDIVRAQVYRDSDEVHAEDAVWFVRVGQWGQWWLNAQGTVWQAPLPRQVLEFDHRANRAPHALAKKIAVNTLVLWASDRSRVFLERRIDHLLEAVGELPRPEYRSAHWAGRMRDRLEEALLLLEESGFLAKVDWAPEFAPGSGTRSKGWVKHWLPSKMVLYIGESLEIQEKDARRGKRGATPSLRTAGRKPPHGDVLRMQRLKSSMTQQQLARKLGVSSAFVSMLENGKRVPSYEMAHRLSRYLNIE